MATTYCTTTDIAFILSAAGRSARADDDEDGSEETGTITSAIERAAVEMNFYLERRYDLSDIASNTWCKWANAYLAVYYLDTRLGNPASPVITEHRDEILELLKTIGRSGNRIPEATESFNFLPRLTNYQANLRDRHVKVIVVQETSVGPSPAAGVKRPI